MKFLILDSKDPYRNLAIEEYLFSHEKDDVFMLWQNEPTVVIGKNQNAYAEIDLAYTKKHGIHVVRRITGGGAVYHDAGNVNYTFISSRQQRSGIDFATFTAPILAALESLGIHAVLSGRNDLLLGDKKFSGNAQHSCGDRVLHHGTLLFDSDLSVLSDALRVDEEKLKARAIRSARSRVTNLKPFLSEPCDTREFIDRIADFVIKTYSPVQIAPPDNETVNALTARNASSEWNFPDRELLSAYQLTKKKRYDFGTVEVYLDMCGTTIQRAMICGDFFGIAPISCMEEALRGAPLSQIPDILSTLDIGACIFGMDHPTLCELLLSE